MASPLLANIALNVLDWHLQEHGFRFVRYADDFLVLCRSEDEAKEALALVERLIADRLGLSLSPEKTKISRFVRIRLKHLRRMGLLSLSDLRAACLLGSPRFP